MLKLHKMIRVPHVVACPIFLFVCLLVCFMIEIGTEGVLNYEN